MKASELTLGNWVKVVDDDTDEFFTGRVTEIGAYNIGVSSTPNNILTLFSIDCIEPIPLSLQTLRRSGFNWESPVFQAISEDQVLSISNNEFTIELEQQLSEELETYYIVRLESGANSCEKYITYTHELQNLISVFNIPVDIVVPC